VVLRGFNFVEETKMTNYYQQGDVETVLSPIKFGFGDDRENSSVNNTWNFRKKQNWMYLVVTVIVAGSALFAVTTYTFEKRGDSASSSSSTVSSDNDYVDNSMTGDYMSIETSNEYGYTQRSMFAYPVLQERLLAEPYKETAFNIQDAVAGAVYTWSIVTASTPTSSASTYYASGMFSTSSVGEVVASGSITAATNFSVSFTATLESVGWYTLTVAETLSTGSVSRSFEQEVVVKYVRREVEDLTDADREAFLDAFHTLWEVNTVDGQALYGKNYKSLHYFASIHNDAGANAVCDEFHGGAGNVL
jgi:hypothetical protein